MMLENEGEMIGALYSCLCKGGEDAVVMFIEVEE